MLEGHHVVVLQLGRLHRLRSVGFAVGWPRPECERVRLRRQALLAERVLRCSLLHELRCLSVAFSNQGGTESIRRLPRVVSIAAIRVARIKHRLLVHYALHSVLVN